MKALDHTGKTFGRLRVVCRIENNEKQQAVWLCRCDCGREHRANAGQLNTGRTTSCGCYKAEISRQNGRVREKAGHKGTIEYNTWQAMKNRCTNPNTQKFMHYGGRGITVCKRWFRSFENFIADMGRKPDASYSIERIDNNGNYCPENCRWATKSEQMLNRRPWAIKNKS